jgi:hypothetical protein
MKMLLVSLTLVLTSQFFAQSKKEQIELLNFRVDSLNQVINSTIVLIGQKDKKITDLENQIVSLNAELDVLKRQDVQSRKSLVEKDIEIQKKTDEISVLKKNFAELRDSLNRSNLKLDTLVWEMQDLTWEQLEFDLKLLLPVARFEKPIGDLLVSKDKKIAIEFDYNQTFWHDQQEENPLFFKPEDAINHYSKGLNQLETSKSDFVIKGKDDSNQLIFIKGIYTDFYSMQGREYGEPKWLWSNTLVLKVTVNEKDIVEFNYITEHLERHFDSDCINFR